MNGMSEKITSRTNPLMTHVRKLCSSRSYRRQSGEFLCDGVKMLEEAVRWGANVTTLIHTERVDVPNLPGVRQVQVPGDIMKSISPMEAPQGALFLCRTADLTPPSRLEGKRYLVLDGLQDPGNVGTIWRTADAFGADGLILVNGCADPYNPKTVRATMGAVFRLPVYETSVEVLRALAEEAELPLCATALREDTAVLGQCDLKRAAVVIGSEGKGVSREMLDACSSTIKIPMEPKCESLNAAAAAAAVLWEMYR
jgi:TrmH family RNA methyltransferase